MQDRPEASKVFESVWLRPLDQRRSRLSLGREEIVTGALSLLDDEGVGGLTMRALAKRLGSAPMSLYYHVSSKEDLVELAIDRVFGEAQEPPADADWYETLRISAQGLFDAFLRHPWVAAALGARPPLGPNATAGMQRILAAFIEAGLTGDRLDGAVTGFYYYIVGAGITEASWMAAAAETGADAADLLERMPHANRATPFPMQEHLMRNATRSAAERFQTGLRTFLEPYAQAQPPGPREPGTSA